MTRWFPRVGLVVAAVMVTAGPALAGEALRVDETQLDLGKVKAGTDAVATFVLHNDGDQEVRILRAKPS